MKTFLQICGLLMLHLAILGQGAKRGNVWVLGYDPILVFDFNNASLIIDTTLIHRHLIFGTSCIANTQGKIELFCNGFYFCDRYANIVEYPDGNFDSINCPLGTKWRDDQGGGSLYNQMSLILPKSKNTYYVFTTGMSDLAFDDLDQGKDFRFDVLSYSVVDMDGNDGKGKIASKNNILIQNERLSRCKMTAVQHANGRDWWLVKPHNEKHQFFIFRVTPDSIYGPFVQTLNLPDAIEPSANGQSCFSPDGNWYAHTQYADRGVYLNRFDRCSGLMEFYHYYPIVVNDSTLSNISRGTAFSRNSQYLYVNTYFDIYQFDISDTSSGSQVCVFKPDSIQYNQAAGYHAMQLAPNNKIYIGNLNGVQKYMTYIDSPDNKGIACYVKFHGLYQPFTNILDPPNMPYFGLGAITNSVCDTVGKLSDDDVVIYPNPANASLHVYIPKPTNSEAKLVLYNLLGQRVMIWKGRLDSKQEVHVNIPALATGLYTLEIFCDGEEYVRKLVVE